jgi:myosin heavy subunit
MHLDKNCKIVGAAIVSYLLEKSRIAFQSKNERNYHIFYQLTGGATKEEQTKYKIQAPESYHYLNQSGCISLPSIPDKKGLEDFKLALQVMQMDSETMEGLFRVLSAILHLGNMQFSDHGDCVEVKSNDSLQNVAELLACDEAQLKQALCFRKITVRGDTTMVPLKLNQVRLPLFVILSVCTLHTHTQLLMPR